MALNSQRELIIEAIKTKVLELQWPTAVKRGRANMDVLRTLPNTQFPYIAVAGQLPVPMPTPATVKSGRSGSEYKTFISTLRVEIITYDYIYDSEQYDVLVSNRADDIWAKLYEDPSFGDQCLSCMVEPEPVVGIWDPYLAFKLTAVVTYNHGTGGI